MYGGRSLSRIDVGVEYAMPSPRGSSLAPSVTRSERTSGRPCLQIGGSGVAHQSSAGSLILLSLAIVGLEGQRLDHLTPRFRPVADVQALPGLSTSK